MQLLKFPSMVGWSVTERCNLSCVYCSQDAGRCRADELDLDESLALVDEIAHHRASVIGFTGGEPFLRPDFEDIVTRAVRRGLRCVVTTNATLLANQPRSFLVKFIKVRISLDSPDAALHDRVRGQAGVYESVLAGIRKVQRLGIKVEIVTTAGRHNASVLRELHDKIEDLGVEEWSLSVLTPIGRGSDQDEYVFTPEEYHQVVLQLVELKERSRLHLKTDIPQNVLLRQDVLRQVESGLTAQEHYCSAATDLLVVFPDGSVGPCFMVPVTEGNVRTDDLYTIWNDSSLFKSFRDKSLIQGNCGDCELLGVCGGCRATAYASTGDLMLGDPLCWHRPLAPYLQPTQHSSCSRGNCPREGC